MVLEATNATSYQEFNINVCKFFEASVVRIGNENSTSV
jgi:hypothetical protein